MKVKELRANGFVKAWRGALKEKWQNVEQFDLLQDGTAVKQTTRKELEKLTRKNTNYLACNIKGGIYLVIENGEDAEVFEVYPQGLSESVKELAKAFCGYMSAMCEE